MSYLGSFKDSIQIKLKDNELSKQKENNLDKDKYEESTKTYTVADNNNEENNQKVVTNDNTNKDDEDELKSILTDEYNSEANKDDDPIEKLKEIDDRIDLLEFYEVPDSLGLEKKEMPTYDEEAEREKLIKILDNEKQEEKTNIENEYETNANKLKKEEETLNKTREENAKAINEIYDAESLNVESQAIKRGLARSSIVLGQLSNVESERANKLTENLENINNKINDIESEIKNLITTRDSALKSLDLDYAEELESKLEESKKDYKKAVDEVIEFNNNVSKLEAEYKLKYEKEKLDWKEGVLDLSQYGYDEFRTKIANAKYDYMVSYLSNFSKVEALSILTGNPSFKELLGDDYAKVYDYVINR